MKKNDLVDILLLSQIIPGLVQCFPVTAGGKGSEQVFYCVSPGCAANVTRVFCDDQQVFYGGHMKECTGHPPPNSLCQLRGRAFVSTTSGGKCEFENNDYMDTQECKELDPACVFPTGAPPSSCKRDKSYTAVIVIGLVVLVVLP